MGYTLTPPDHVIPVCKCGRMVINIFIPDDSEVATVNPCGCQVTASELTEIIQNSIQ